jgi:hypothetical protein
VRDALGICSISDDEANHICQSLRGGLWIARSDWNWGTLDQLDPVTGAPQRRYEIAPGTEGIAFGNAGRLWAVSEAGSRHIYDHPFLDLFQPFFPLVFALDLSRLE